MMKILLASWILYPIMEAIIQSYLIEEKNWKPNYLMLFTIRGMFSIVHGIIMNVEPYPWYDYPVVVLFQCFTFWIVFDVVLNVLRGKEVEYRGKTSGWLDRLIPEFLYWTLKTLALAGAIIIFMVYEHI